MNRAEILEILHHSKRHGNAIKLKITHEHNPFIADVEEILDEKEVVKVKPVSVDETNAIRTSYYVDEIEAIERASVFFNLPLYRHLIKGKK